MKMTGILFLGLFAGITSAAASVISGGGVWAALLNYLGFGMAFTFLGVGILLWRAYESERAGQDVGFVGARPATGK